MNKKKLVFILNSISIQRAVKRINCFVDEGYDVEVYTFRRTDVNPCPVELHFDYTIIGEFPNRMSYKKRLLIVYNGIRKLVPRLRHKKCVLYLMGMDVAVIASLIIHKPYIYEEADLVHTYISYKILRCGLEWLDIRIIRKSLLTILTSEGFIDYHFKGKCPSNVLVVSNKLNPAILDVSDVPASSINCQNLKLGFVGSFRFDSVRNFCRVFLLNFPQHELHVYGTINKIDIRDLIQYNNFIYHGPFINPDDLPAIYANIDISLATYDAYTLNARYAEPNKIYESIYFRTPLIVSRNTMLEEKVDKLQIGFSVDALDDNGIVGLINSLNEESISKCVESIKRIPRVSAVCQNGILLERINVLMNL